MFCRRTFISYRRADATDLAGRIRDNLRRHLIDAFLDVDHEFPGNAPFPDELRGQIARRRYFVLVLTPGALDRCSEPNDWLLREIEYALTFGRVILPVLVDDFKIADYHRRLPPTTAVKLSELHATTVRRDDGFDAAMDRLRGRMRFGGPCKVGAAVLALAVVLAALALLVRACGSDDDPPSSTTGTETTVEGTDDRLGLGERLSPGKSIVSPDGRHRLTMRETGQLVLTTDGVVVWTAPGTASPGATAVMQKDDGNFVVYAGPPPADPRFSTHTAHVDATVVIVEEHQGRASLVLRRADGSFVARFGPGDEPDSTASTYVTETSAGSPVTPTPTPSTSSSTTTPTTPTTALPAGSTAP